MGGNAKPLLIAVALFATAAPVAAVAQFVTGLAGGSGSTIGPGGGLFVTEPMAARISRVLLMATSLNEQPAFSGSRHIGQISLSCAARGAPGHRGGDLTEPTAMAVSLNRMESRTRFRRS